MRGGVVLAFQFCGGGVSSLCRTFPEEACETLPQGQMAHVAVESRASGQGKILPAGSSLAQVESTPKVIETSPRSERRADEPLIASARRSLRSKAMLSSDYVRPAGDARRVNETKPHLPAVADGHGSAERPLSRDAARA